MRKYKKIIVFEKFLTINMYYRNTKMTFSDETASVL
jgi:hypothetical protein